MYIYKIYIYIYIFIFIYIHVYKQVSERYILWVNKNFTKLVYGSNKTDLCFLLSIKLLKLKNIN